MRLEWAAVPGAVGYEVYQWRQGKWWLNEDDPNRTPFATSTTITGLEPNTAYEFAVKAVGEGGVTSGLSASSGARTAMPGQTVSDSGSAPARPSFRTPKGPAPEPPTGIIGIFAEQDRVRLSWRPVPGAVRYSVEEEVDGRWKPAEKVMGDPAATSVVLIEHPTPGPYKLRVRAVNREGTLSDPSWAITVER